MRTPPLFTSTLIRVTACHLAAYHRAACLLIACLLGVFALLGMPLAASAHDDGTHTEPPPATPAPDAVPPASIPTALDLIEQGQVGGKLFFPYVGQDGTSAAPLDGEQTPQKPDEPGGSPAPADPVAEHSHDDYTLAEQARLRDEPPFVAPEMEAAAPTDLNQIGQWGPVVTWPFAFATAANLPDGRILAWGGNNTMGFSGGTTTYATVWDPATGQFLSRNHSSHSMFCAIPTMLEDGRVFVNGGDGTRERTSTFDFRTNAWTRIQDMKVGRWYNGAVALPNGQVFTAVGDPGSRYPEIWTATTGWAYLTGADLQASLLNFPGYQNNWLPYLFLNADGRIFHSGPTKQMNWITPTGNGSVASAGLNNPWYPKYSASVMYDEGKILVAGGQISETNLSATNQALVIDLNSPTPTITTVAPMANRRKFNNAVVLPNGEVLMIGGNTSGTEFSDDGTILASEIWNPATRTWRTVAPISVPRNYHSVALLMTDGRVFSGGGGLCFCNADHPDHQVYSPPYLFNADGSPAPRPLISSAPDVVGYGRTVSVAATPGVQKFSLIKMSGTTHNLNSDLRFLNLPFVEVSSGQYQFTLHANRNVLTPGYWMLFALNVQGVPSIAKVVKVSSNDAPIVTNPGAQSTAQGSMVSLQIVASDPTGDAMTFSAVGLPPGLSINVTSGLIGGSPTTAGGYNVTVNVSDSTNTSSTSFAWAVPMPGLVRYVKLETLSAANNNPWASAAEFNLMDGNNLVLARSQWKISADSVEIVAEDGRAVNAIDGNPATFWATQWYAASPTHPHWLLIDLGTASNVAGFRFLQRVELPHEWVRDFRFFVSADGVNWGAAVVTGTFGAGSAEHTVTVPQTTPPNVPAPAPQVHANGSAVNLPLGASDSDGDPLAYSATGLPGGLSINGAGVITGVINAPQGIYTVTVSVRDSRGFAGGVTFGWTVSAPALVLNPLATAPGAVNVPLTLVASSTSGQTVRYKWQFGDGTAETAYTASPSVSYTYRQPGLYLVRVTATDDRGMEQSVTAVQAVHLPLTGSKPRASSSIGYAPQAGGAGGNGRVWVVNADADTVTVFDAATNARLAEVAVGAAPRALAVAPPGSPAGGQVWVSNKGAGGLSVVDGGSFAVLRTLPLGAGSQPFGVVFAPDGSAAYVVLEGRGQVLKLDPLTGSVLGSVGVGPNPRHLAVSADGSTLLVARFVTPPLPGESTASVQTTVNGSAVGGEVVVVNAASMSVVQTVVLQVGDKNDTEVQGRGVPNYLGAPVIAPDGAAAWVPSKQDNVQRGVLRDGNGLNFQNTVRAISSRIDLSSLREDYGARLDHDNAGMASGAAFDPYGLYLFVALESSREVAVVDVFGRRELLRLPVGRAPQGVAVSPDGTRLYVNNFMDRTVSVLDISSLFNGRGHVVTPLATVGSVAIEKLPAPVLLGKQLFYDAKDSRLAADAYISCAACHNDGSGDGRVWDLSGFGEGLRSTISLNGHGGMGQGLLHWSGNFDEVQDFEGQIRALAGGSGLLTNADFAATQDPLGLPKAGKSAELDALAAYVASLTGLGASPFRNADGTLTSAGAAGKVVFAAADCTACHGGSGFTNSAAGSRPDVGTRKPASGSRLGQPLTGLDIPTLRDVWQTGPYLHDGSARTLGAAVQAHTAVPAAQALNAADLAALVEYLHQIDGSEPPPSGPPPPNQPPSANITAPANTTSFSQGVTISIAATAADADGTIARVEFYAGAALLNTDSASPYSFAWTNAAVGAYVLTARAYDNAGAATTSAAVNITVNALPPPPSPPPTAGLQGAYFNNVSMSGTPVLQRVEAVNFTWLGSPGPNVNSDNFSVRWTGRIYAPATGTYYFRTVSDDGVRLWINNTRRINNWTDHAATTNTSGGFTLQGGQWHTVKLEFYDRAQDAVIQLLWRTPGTTQYTVIPATQFTPQ